jgi:hypothetical protein
MPSYLTIAAYKTITTIDASVVDLCAAKGKDVGRWLELKSGHIRARLVKRYAVDFNDPGPPPDKIIEWLVLLVDILVWACAGGLPEGREDGWAKEAEKTTLDEIKEAADSETGLFELPLRDTDPLGTSAINKGPPFVVAYNTGFDYFDAVKANSSGKGPCC